MSWCRLEDDMDENRKLRRLSHEAFRLYWIGVTYARRQQTGGRLHLDDIQDLAARHRIKNVKAAIADLVHVPVEYGYEFGCWELVAPDLYQVHDHEEYNPPTSRERMRAKRLRDRASQGGDGDDDVTSPPVTCDGPRDGSGDGQVTHGDTPRAQERAGYPDPVPVPGTTGLRPYVPPQPPSGGSVTVLDGEFLAGYEAFLAELCRSTGRQFGADAISRSRYADRRRDGFSAEDLLAAARGVAMSKFHMGLNDSALPHNDPDSVLRSRSIRQFIGWGRGEMGVIREETAEERRTREWDEAGQRRAAGAGGPVLNA